MSSVRKERAEIKEVQLKPVHNRMTESGHLNSHDSTVIANHFNQGTSHGKQMIAQSSLAPNYLTTKHQSKNYRCIWLSPFKRDVFTQKRTSTHTPIHHKYTHMYIFVYTYIYIHANLQIFLKKYSLPVSQ